MDWVNAALVDDPVSPRAGNPTVRVTDDFAPPDAMPSAKATITKMSRAQLSQMDLASLSDRFGTLTMAGGRRGMGTGLGEGHKMLREESGFDLAGMAGEDEVF